MYVIWKGKEVSKVPKVVLSLFCLLCTTPAISGPACTSGKGFGAVDISYQTNNDFLNRIKAIGVSTVIRYYDWVHETLPGKTLTSGELARIRQNSLELAVVFQHNNDKTSTFETVDRGTIDAKRSLDLARSFEQPANSAIYFGVDGVYSQFFDKNGRSTNPDKYGITLIKRYFA